MKLRYIGKGDIANGLEHGEIVECGIETAFFESETREDQPEFVLVLFHDKECPEGNRATFKPYKSFRKMFEEWEELSGS